MAYGWATRRAAGKGPRPPVPGRSRGGPPAGPAGGGGTSRGRGERRHSSGCREAAGIALSRPSAAGSRGCTQRAVPFRTPFFLSWESPSGQGFLVCLRTEKYPKNKQNEKKKKDRTILNSTQLKGKDQTRSTPPLLVLSVLPLSQKRSPNKKKNFPYFSFFT